MRLMRTEMIPAHLRPGLLLWIEHGIVPGSFLQAVLANDLLNAVDHADEESMAGLRSLVQWLWNYAPAGCHGLARNAAWSTWKGTPIEVAP